MVSSQLQRNVRWGFSLLAAALLTILTPSAAWSQEDPLQSEIDSWNEALIQSETMTGDEIEELRKELVEELGGDLLEAYDKDRELLAPEIDKLPTLDERIDKAIVELRSLAEGCKRGECSSDDFCIVLQQAREQAELIRNQLRIMQPPLLARLLSANNFLAVQLEAGQPTGSAQSDKTKLSDFLAKAISYYPSVIGRTIETIDGCKAKKQCKDFGTNLELKTLGDYRQEAAAALDGETVNGDSLNYGGALFLMLGELEFFVDSLEGNNAELKLMASGVKPCPPEDNVLPPVPDSISGPSTANSTGSTSFDPNAQLPAVDLTANSRFDCANYDEERAGIIALMNSLIAQRDAIRNRLAQSLQQAKGEYDDLSAEYSRERRRQGSQLNAAAYQDRLRQALLKIGRAEDELKNWDNQTNFEAKALQDGIDAHRSELRELERDCPPKTRNVVPGSEVVSTQPDPRTQTKEPFTFFFPLIVASDSPEYCEARKGNGEYIPGIFTVPHDGETTCPGGGSDCDPPPDPDPPTNTPGECPGGGSECEPTTAGGPTTAGWPPPSGDLPPADGDAPPDPDELGPDTPEGTQTPGGGVTTTGGPSTPEPGNPATPEDDCERLARLVKEYNDLVEVGPGPDPKQFWSEINRLYMIITALGSECPNEDSEVESPSAIGSRLDPDQVSVTPEPQIPNIPTDVFIKGGTRTTGDNSLAELGGQQVKLFDPSVQQLALPKDKPQPKTDFVFEPNTFTEKPQIASGKDPMQGVTDKNGELRIQASLTDLTFGGFSSFGNFKDFTQSSGPTDGAGPPLNGTSFIRDSFTLELDIDLTKQDSRNVIIKGPDPDYFYVMGLADQAQQATGAEISEVKPLGDGYYFTVTFDAAQADKVDQALGAIFGNNGLVEINKCREKKPLAPMPDGTFSAPPASAELRGASITLGLIGSENPS